MSVFSKVLKSILDERRAFKALPDVERAAITLVAHAKEYMLSMAGKGIEIEMMAYDLGNPIVGNVVSAFSRAGVDINNLTKEDLDEFRRIIIAKFAEDGVRAYYPTYHNVIRFSFSEEEAK